MEDITDPSFRMVCKMNGADFMYTEFVSSDGLIRDGKRVSENLIYMILKDQSVFSYMDI